MATLNLKNFPDTLYRKLKRQARAQHRSVSQQVALILSTALEQPEPLSILALRGLGKERWAGIDPTRHVRSERKAWD